MKVGIFINTTKSDANKHANKFGAILHDKGIDSKVVNLKEDCKDVDLIAVFGGDGTILRVVEYAISYDIPILAVNTGTLGFLTCVESSELEKALDIITSKKPHIEKRSVLKVRFNGEKYYALNEVLVQRNQCGVCKLALEIGGKFVDKLNADGIIISTPNGSTAYSLSAGGSVLTPDINAFIATPICSHSLHNRPIVYSDNNLASIKLLETSNKCTLFIDGKKVTIMNAGDKIEVLKSKKMVKFYSTENNFFEKLIYKLSKWSEV